MSPRANAWSEASDEELAARFQAGDSTALKILIERYRGFTRAKARTYFLMGADTEDIEQEGLIGLFKAARDFRPERGMAFRSFAKLCITRQVITAVKGAIRHKHRALNDYVSVTPAGSGADWLDKLSKPDPLADPAEQLASRESAVRLQLLVTSVLSVLEAEVFRLYDDGYSYEEIGRRLGRRVRAIDNALQRMRRKVEKQLGATTPRFEDGS